ncbi:unnamed protein product [Rhizophagus irregularis]|nr:unnamed protein product [Rhizophagus irregularis]
MTERVRRPYVRKGEGKFQIKPSRFETDAQDYDIVSDLENMKPNINFAQLVAAAPKYGMEVKKAFQRQRDEYTDDEKDPTYENNEEIETFRVEDLEEEYISEDEEEVK